MRACTWSSRGSPDASVVLLDELRHLLCGVFGCHALVRNRVDRPLLPFVVGAPLSSEVVVPGQTDGDEKCLVDVPDLRDNQAIRKQEAESPSPLASSRSPTTKSRRSSLSEWYAATAFPW